MGRLIRACPGSPANKWGEMGSVIKQVVLIYISLRKLYNECQAAHVALYGLGDELRQWRHASILDVAQSHAHGNEISEAVGIFETAHVDFDQSQLKEEEHRPLQDDQLMLRVLYRAFDFDRKVPNIIRKTAACCALVHSSSVMAWAYSFDLRGYPSNP